MIQSLSCPKHARKEEEKRQVDRPSDYERKRGRVFVRFVVRCYRVVSFRSLKEGGSKFRKGEGEGEGEGSGGGGSEVEGGLQGREGFQVVERAEDDESEELKPKDGAESRRDVERTPSLLSKPSSPPKITSRVISFDELQER